LAAHPIGTGGQQLQHRDIAVEVNNYARERITVAIEEPVAIGIRGNDPMAKFERSLNSIRDNVRGLDAIAECQHPHGDSSRRIEIAEAQPVSGNIENSHTIAGCKLSRLQSCDGLREDPRIPTPHGSVAILLEDDAASDFHSFVLADIAQLSNSWELRAATMLARLFVAQSWQDEARSNLASIL